MLIKFCGMRQPDCIELAASLGLNMCGFIFHPKSPRFIEPGAAARLPAFGMKRVGVFVHQNEAEIKDIIKIARLDFIQLHGEQDEKCALKLGRERIIRVIWPQRFPNTEALNRHLEKMSPYSAYFLLDAGKSLGGSGARLDPGFLKNLRSPLPYFLAGGLSPDNALDVLAALSPAGLDVNSGLESSPGFKDQNKIRAFFSNLQKYKNGAMP